jgi:hypothetical protein
MLPLLLLLLRLVLLWPSLESLPSTQAQEPSASTQAQGSQLVLQAL